MNHVHPVIIFFFQSSSLNVLDIFRNSVCVYVCTCECVLEDRFCLLAWECVYEQLGSVL